MAVKERNFTAVFIHFVQLRICSILITFSWAFTHFLAQPEWFADNSSLLRQASRSQHLQFKLVNINHKYLVIDYAGQSKTPLTVPAAAILEHLEKGQFSDLLWRCPDVKLLCLLGSKRLLCIDKLVSLSRNHNLSNVKITLCSVSIKPVFLNKNRYATNIGFLLKDVSCQIWGFIQSNLLLVMCSGHTWRWSVRVLKGTSGSARETEGAAGIQTLVCIFVCLCLFACESDHV